jgi:phosphate transport system substrate-binding protein
MLLSATEIKKRIINVIIDFYLNKSQSNLSDPQLKEFMSMGLELDNLVDMLRLPPEQFAKTGVWKPLNVSSTEYLKLYRILDLAFRYKSDVNSIAIDIGENLSSTNKYLQMGMDYLLANLGRKDHKKIEVIPRTKAQNKPIQKEQIRRPEVAGRRSGGGIGFITVLIFFAVLAWAAFTVYNNIFDKHATKVSTLVHEYRTDRQLSSVKRSDNVKNIRISGSGSLIHVIEDFQGKFLQMNPDLSLELSATNSTEAIQSLLDRKSNIAVCSRIPTIDERKKSQQEGILLADHKIALDAVAVTVHPSNPLNSVSVDVLRKIFAADNPNWNDYTYYDRSIERFSPSLHNGTHYFFQERVMFTEKMSPQVVQVYDIGQMINLVASNPSAIAYASLSDVIDKPVKVLAVSTILDDRAISPLRDGGLIDVTLIKRGEYPLTRYVYAVTAGELTDATAKFIDFLRSNEVQSSLGRNGLVSIF